MGEQSKESEPDETASYDPFIRCTVEYDASTRLQMAESVASTRNLFLSPALKEIFINPENFFHGCQQSYRMTEDANRRRQVSYNTKREAYIQQRRADGLPLPSKIPMIEINPTRVTLSLEFESQYYSLMTNDYGDHENIASIMKETNTLIQLPDRSVEGSHSDPFSQQITITGHYSDVDRARKLMRQNCHVSVFMSLSKLKNSTTDIHEFIAENPVQNVDVSFIDSLPEKNGEVGSYLRYTSREKNLPQLINAADRIIEKFCDKSNVPEHMFSLHFTLTTSHAEHIIGTSATGFLMPNVENNTETSIKFPNICEVRGNLFIIEIKGAVEKVLEARACIMELLPISLSCNLQNTDMFVSCPTSDRDIALRVHENRTIFKMYPSEFEPSELLSDEVELHCASFRSREFNIKQMYATYQKMLTKNIGVVAPQPTEYDKSMWHRCLPSKFYDYNVPCRGESEASNNIRRTRSASVTSLRSKNSHPSKANLGSEPSGSSSRYQTRVSSVSESSTQPLPSFPDPQLSQSQFAQMMLMNQACLKGSQLFLPFPPGIAIYIDPTGFRASGCPENLQFDAYNRMSFPVMPTNEVPRSAFRTESSSSARPHNTNRNTAFNMNRPSSAGEARHHSPTHRQSRIYDRVREDDVRSSPRSGSRRTSLNGDEQSAEHFDENRQYQRQYQRPSYNEPRWRTSSRGDMYGKRNGTFNREYHTQSQTQETNNETAGPSDQTLTADNNNFQSTHRLKLKPNDIDLDQERLYTHESPQVEQLGFSSGGYGNELMDGDFVQRLLSSASLNDLEKRTRAISCLIDRDDQSTKFTDSDCAHSLTDYAMTYPLRTIDSVKKVPCVGVSKTMLEPRSRNEREYGKISLEHKDKHYIDMNDGEKYDGGPTLGLRQYRMDPMKLIASVRESSEQLPRINERQFSDVLNDKERELAAFREKNSESTLVQEPSLDYSTTMNYAFRNEQSPEKF